MTCPKRLGMRMKAVHRPRAATGIAVPELHPVQRLPNRGEPVPACPSRSSLMRRCFSSGGGSRPRFQIPAHVAAFSLMMVPALAFYAFYETKGKPTPGGDLEDELRGRYKREIEIATSKNKAMGEMFRRMNMVNGGGGGGRSDEGEDKKLDDQKLDELLRAGKGGKKRIAAVDDRIYGTPEGAKERDRLMEEYRLHREELKRKAKNRKKKRKAESDDEVNAAVNMAAATTGADEATTTKPPRRRRDVVQKSPKKKSIEISGDAPLAPKEISSKNSNVITLFVVAAAAATVGFLAGGSKRW